MLYFYFYFYFKYFWKVVLLFTQVLFYKVILLLLKYFLGEILLLLLKYKIKVIQSTLNKYCVFIFFCTWTYTVNVVPWRNELASYVKFTGHYRVHHAALLLIKVTQTREFDETSAIFVLFTGDEHVSKCRESAFSKMVGKWEIKKLYFKGCSWQILCKVHSLREAFKPRQHGRISLLETYWYGRTKKLKRHQSDSRWGMQDFFTLEC